ncbi:hypothetical protein HY486_00915 [Candidatus Woesearchaeota archaeon]|nr:hypothetical protein [Candidatus Woesearchaeota archaeon]
MQVGIAGIVGRIGTLTLCECLSRNIPVVCGTDLPTVKVWGASGKLLEMSAIEGLDYKINNEDPAHGRLPWSSRKKNNDTLEITINGKTYCVKVIGTDSPEKAKWQQEGVEFVEECTGMCLDKTKVSEEDLKKNRWRYPASVHYNNGARIVFVSAPSNKPDASLVLGINHKNYEKFKNEKGCLFFDNGSCTTKAVAFPIAVLLNEGYVITSPVYVVTTHADTGKELRDLIEGKYNPNTASIREHSSGAFKALAALFNTQDNIQVPGCDAKALRVPVVNGSMADICLTLCHNLSAKDVNAMFAKASGDYRYATGIYLWTNQTPLNSNFISRREGLFAQIGYNPSSVVSAENTKVYGDRVHIHSWYNNEGAPPENQARMTQQILSNAA